MSGQLKWLNSTQKLVKHDHIIIYFNHAMQLRFHDPRRFGSVLWFATLLEDNRLNHLGVEPLTDHLNFSYILFALKKRSITIKQFLMDAKIVVGVGNIYANEVLFLSKIRPNKPSNTITKKEAKLLVTCIKEVLTKAIAQGGTTIKDFQHIDGKAGYFKQELLVYGRGGEPCLLCGEKLEQTMIANRQTVYCDHCQS